MGNSPSTSKPATPTPPSRGHSQDEPHRDGRRKEPKNLIPVHQQRSAASTEASLAQAQGSTIVNRNANSRPLSTLNSSSPSASSNTSSSTLPTRPAAESKPKPPPEVKDEPSKPVAVPVSHAETSHTSQRSTFEDTILTSGPHSASVQDMAYHMNRPPRLPLPIEEEVHTPGSPIIAPADVSESVDDVESLDQNGLPRRASGLSNATDDEDAEELRVDKTRPTVPTRVEWLQGGQKVYVTGTPFQWSRKQRLHPAKNREGVLEAVIPVFPGTHHIKFLVDGNMQTSPDLPTTVDFGNNLVNYIEVSGNDTAIPTPDTLEAGAPKTDKDAEALPSRQGSQSQIEGESKLQTKKAAPLAEKFSSHIPRYLFDFDQAEDTRQYQLSIGAVDKLPMPPSLPGFLSKPIMNNTTLVKDDNSVLNMPNHTVLNHLATCSIKNGVLSVSATTRYRDKYVTTIIHKPTSTTD